MAAYRKPGFTVFTENCFVVIFYGGSTRATKKDAHVSVRCASSIAVVWL